MKVTKYPQSCLVLEGEGRVCIDLGTIATADYGLDDLGHLDAVLWTHQHADHFDPGAAAELLERGVALYGNADVCEQIGEGANEVRDGEIVEVAGFEVTPRVLPHVEMVDGSPGPPNTGFVVDGAFFHPGDGIELAGLSVDTLAVPIVGPSISYRDAYLLVESTGAETVIPIHYDFFQADPDLFAGFCDIADVQVLGHGDSTSI